MEFLNHQKSALAQLNKALAQNKGFLHGDPAGTGKTLPALLAAKANAKKGSIVLWLTLASLKYQVEAEVKKFGVDFAPIVLAGGKKERESLLSALPENCLLIMNYEQLLIHKVKLTELPISVIVSDECNRLGNQKNKTYKTLLLLANYLKAKRIAVSGTPINNHPLEAYALFDYLNPGCLGDWYAFARTFMSATPFSMVGAVKTAALPRLARLLAPYYIRRDREALLPDLPDLIEENLPIALSEAEIKLYNKIRDELITELEAGEVDKISHISTIQDGIVKFARLRQCCVAASLLGTGNKEDSKIKALVEFLSTINGSKAIIFTEFASVVPLILKAVSYGANPNLAVAITGQTPAEERNRIIGEFRNRAEVKYLVGTKAIEMGLNLPEADFVVHFDPPLTYSALDQRISRARRQGRKHSVVSVKMVCLNTLEERIYKLIEKKKLISLAAMPFSELRKELL